MQRRTFLQSAGISLGLFTLFPGRSLADIIRQPAYKFSLLRNSVGIFTESGGTIAWMSNKSGIVVVDSQFPDPEKVTGNKEDLKAMQNYLEKCFFS